MSRLELLKKLSFGTQVAEEETKELASYFVETDEWDRIFSGKIDIVRGEKGAGKSAIYSLLLERKTELFDNGVIVVAAENPRGATVFKDLAADPPTSEVEFIVLWKLYIITIVAQQLREFGVNTENAGVVYPSQRPFITKLENQKTEQTPDSLSELWGLDRAAAIAKAKELVELVFFEERGTREEPTFWVPFLYRDALDLKQGKADAEED